MQGKVFFPNNMPNQTAPSYMNQMKNFSFKNNYQSDFQNINKNQQVAEEISLGSWRVQN